jgi:hypothetical protein
MSLAYSPTIWLPGAEPGTFVFEETLDDWDAPVEEDSGGPPAVFLGVKPEQ